MDHLELTADGRLLQRRRVETPEGLRPEVKDFTADAHLLLNRQVELGEGVRLASLFELLKANPTLLELQSSNFASAYLQRYEAIRRGEVVPKTEPQEENGPEIEALVLSRVEELELPLSLWQQVVQAHAKPMPTSTDLSQPYESETCASSLDREHLLPTLSGRWDFSGLSYPSERDTKFYGVDYQAGQRLNYSMSFRFDRAIDLPLRIMPGSLSLEVRGARRKEWSVVKLTLGTAAGGLGITLYDLIESILFDLSFHGDPENTQSVGDELLEQYNSLEDDSNSEDLTISSASIFCDWEKYEEMAQELSDENAFWDEARACAHTGLSAQALNKRVDQGRLIKLSATATDTLPSRNAFPSAQFAPGFDTELLRYLNWVGSASCSTWATHHFLKSWVPPTSGDQAQKPADTLLNGWDALSLAEVASRHEEISDPELRGHGLRVSPLRPVFPEDSVKGALVEAFEAFAAERRRAYEEG